MSYNDVPNSDSSTKGLSTENQYQRNDAATTVGRVNGCIITNTLAQLELAAGEVYVQDTLSKEIVTVPVAAQNLTPPHPDANDHTYQLSIDEAGILVATEILTDVQPGYPTNLRDAGFLGICFYNGSIGGWTAVGPMSVEVNRPGSSTYGVHYAIGPSVFAFDPITFDPASVSSLKLQFGEGTLFLAGCNYQVDDTRPHTLRIASTQDPYNALQNVWRTAPNTYKPFQDQGKLVVDFANTPLWTKLDDNTGVLKDVGDEEWACMPVTVGALNLLGTSANGTTPDVIPFVYMSQVAIPNGQFLKDPEGEARRALIQHEFDPIKYSNLATAGILCMRGDATSTDDPGKFMVFIGTPDNLTPTDSTVVSSFVLNSTRNPTFDPLNLLLITTAQTLLDGTRHKANSTGVTHTLPLAQEGFTVEIELGVATNAVPLVIAAGSGDTVEGGASIELEGALGDRWRFSAINDTEWQMFKYAPASKTRYVNAETTVYQGERLAVDTTDGSFDIFAAADVTSFEVFDAEGTWNTNAPTVYTPDGDDWLLNQRRREFEFYIGRGGLWTWKRTNVREA